MGESNVVTVGDRGRLVLPAELRRKHGWETGTRLFMIETDDGVVLMTHQQLEDYVLGEWSTVDGHEVLDELFAERRAAAQADLDEVDDLPA